MTNDLTLPEPRTLSRGDEDGPIQLGYTADQMREYGEQVRRDYSFTHAQMWLRRFHDGIAAENEACAKLCERLYARDCAAAIRAQLKGIQSENCNCPGFCTGACERNLK